MDDNILLEMDHNILVQKWVITFVQDVQDDNISREMDDNKVAEDDNILVEKWMIT